MTTLHILHKPLTTIYTSAEIAVGTQYTDASNGKRYVFCYNGGATVLAAGDNVGAFLTTPLYGNISRTDGTCIETTLASTCLCAGIAISAIPTVNWGWIQVGGYCSNITTDQGVAAGDLMVIDGGTTPTFLADTAVAGEEAAVFAVADAADTVAVGTGFLIGCIFDF